MKTNACMGVLLLMLAGGGLAVRAEENVSAPVTPPVTAEKDAAKAEGAGKEDAVDSTKKSADLAAKYGVPEQTILDLRQKNNLGWGEIDHALQIAQQVVKTSSTQITLDDALKQVMDQRGQGLGWGQIADKYGVKLGHLKHEGLDKPKKDRPAPDGGRPPDKPERPVRPDKPDNPGKGNQ